MTIAIECSKRGRLQKLKIVKPLIEKLMPITAQEGPEDINEDAPPTVALGVLNVLSTNLPPQQVFPTVITHVVQYMQNADPLFRKGAMLSLANVIEGCVDYTRTGTSEIIAIICAGLGDSDARVRSASCVALATVSNELSEEVGEHHEELVPLIFNILNDSNMTIVKYALTALDVIIEGMGDSVVRYLRDLMLRMVVVLETGTDDLKPLALSVIGSVAHSSGQAFGPYFDEVIARIKHAMALTGDDDAMALRGVATDTAATVAEAAGKEAFSPHLEETMKLALQGMELESPNLRECGYCYFGVMSRVFGSDFTPFLSHIAPQLLQTLRIDESSAFGLEADEEPDMDDEDGQGQLGMSTAVADEKEVAIDAVGELFASTTSGFLPYVEDIAKELVALLDHYSDSVRKSAVGSLFTFIRTFGKIGNAEKWQAGVPLVAVDDNTMAMIRLVLPALLKMWEDEDDKMVVAQICTELRSAMSEVGPAVTIEYAEQISVRLLEIFEKKALCQTIDDDFDDEGGDELDEEDLTEYDSMLICAAADCVAEFADVFGEAFTPIMDTFLPHIAGYAKPTFAVSERAMAVGCLAEIAKNMGPAITKYAETLFPIFMAGLRDEHAEVASNGAFAVGALIEAATIDATPYFGEVLKALYPLVKRSDNTNNARDNAAGCVARLILENADAVPLADVLPAWIEALPIRNDHMEDLPVYDAICHLLKNKRAEIEQFLPSLMPVLKQAMESTDTLFSDESRQYLGSFGASVGGDGSGLRRSAWPRSGRDPTGLVQQSTGRLAD
ncbi:hypothetical protein IWW45_000166 [Coemansia sp. RSA 485]|nr:hypothetical protein IWW45_000166 [Coemansia sp. RSA 485]